MWDAVKCGAHVAEKGPKQKAHEPGVQLVSLILGQESI